MWLGLVWPAVEPLPLLCHVQGKLDAIWALFRRGYDQVSLMRPQPGDHVSTSAAHRGNISFHQITHTHSHSLPLLLPPVVFCTCDDPQLCYTLLFRTIPFHLHSSVMLFQCFTCIVFRFCWVHSVIWIKSKTFWLTIRGMIWKRNFFSWYNDNGNLWNNAFTQRQASHF